MMLILFILQAPPVFFMDMETPGQGKINFAAMGAGRYLRNRGDGFSHKLIQDGPDTFSQGF
jgi:hypothetical protein